MEIAKYNWTIGEIVELTPSLTPEMVIVVPGSPGPPHNERLEFLHQERLEILKSRYGKEIRDDLIVRADSLTLLNGQLIIAAGPINYWRYVTSTNEEVRKAAGLPSEIELAKYCTNPTNEILWQKIPHPLAPHQFGVVNELVIRGGDEGERILLLTKKSVATPWPESMELQTLAGHARFNSDIGPSGFWNPFISAIVQASQESGIKKEEIEQLTLSGIHTDPDQAGTSYVNGIFRSYSDITYAELLRRKGDGENKLVAAHYEFSELRDLAINSLFASQPYMTGLFIELFANRWDRHDTLKLCLQLTQKVAEYERADKNGRFEITRHDVEKTREYIQNHLVLRPGES